MRAKKGNSQEKNYFYNSPAKQRGTSTSGAENPDGWRKGEPRNSLKEGRGKGVGHYREGAPGQVCLLIGGLTDMKRHTNKEGERSAVLTEYDIKKNPVGRVQETEASRIAWMRSQAVKD